MESTGVWSTVRREVCRKIKLTERLCRFSFLSVISHISIKN